MSFSKRIRGLAAVLALLCLICTISACAGSASPQKLSDLDDAALLQLLADHEVTVPAGLEAASIRDAIAERELEPDKPAPVVGWTMLADFYEQLRALVKDYYGIAP